MKLPALNSRWLLIAPVLGLVFLGFAATAVTLWRGVTASESAYDANRRSTFTIPPDQSYGGSNFGAQLDISPDGTTIVYVGRVRGRRQLFLKKLDKSEPRLIPGTEFPNLPTFSPDGRQIAYITDDYLKKIRIEGGEPQTVGKADSSTARGIAWAENGSFILGNSRGPLMVLDGKTEDPVPLVKNDRYGPEIPHMWPHVLPGGKAVLFSRMNWTLDAARIGVLNLQTGEESILHNESGYAPRYTPSGHIVYVRGRRHVLMTARFDLKGLTMQGSPKRALEEDVNGGSSGSTDMSLASNGVLVFTRRNASDIDELIAGISGYELNQIHVVPNWFEELKRLAP
jgi:hypothetical protein